MRKRTCALVHGNQFCHPCGHKRSKGERKVKPLFIITVIVKAINTLILGCICGCIPAVQLLWAGVNTLSHSLQSCGRWWHYRLDNIHIILKSDFLIFLRRLKHCESVLTPSYKETISLYYPPNNVHPWGRKRAPIHVLLYLLIASLYSKPSLLKTKVFTLNKLNDDTIYPPNGHFSAESAYLCSVFF